MASTQYSYEQPVAHVYRRLGIFDRLTRAFAAVPAVCFTGALFTDMTYASSPDMQWTNFSAWLLAAGMLFGSLAVVTGIIAYIIGPRPRPTLISLLYLAAIAVILVTAFFNNLVHSRDALTSVVPTGLTLSVITVLAMIVAAILRTMSTPLAYEEPAR